VKGNIRTIVTEPFDTTRTLWNSPDSASSDYGMNGPELKPRHVRAAARHATFHDVLRTLVA